MKKINLIIALIVAVTFFSALVFAPGSVSSQKEKKEAVANQIPDSLAKIFKVSCTPCHYDGGSKAACFGLNFSGWNKYTAEKQAKKAALICKKITAGSMPPKSFKEIGRAHV